MKRKKSLYNKRQKFVFYFLCDVSYLISKFSCILLHVSALLFQILPKISFLTHFMFDVHVVCLTSSVTCT